MGVLTHLDSFTNPTTLRRTKKTMKHRFWTDIYEGCKLFYLSGLKHGRYPKTEVANPPPLILPLLTSTYLLLPPSYITGLAGWLGADAHARLRIARGRRQLGDAFYALLGLSRQALHTCLHLLQLLPFYCLLPCLTFTSAPPLPPVHLSTMYSRK